MLEQLLTQLDSLLGSAFYFPFLLVGAGLFFTLYLGFPQIRFFTHGWKVLFGRYSDAYDPGDTSHFQDTYLFHPHTLVHNNRYRNNIRAYASRDDFFFHLFLEKKK